MRLLSKTSIFRLRNTATPALMTSFIKTAFQAVTSSGLDKPKFSVTKTCKEHDYEERQFPPTMWVSTRVQSMHWKDATSTGFRRLFNYIQGQNEPEKKVAMTAPVATHIQPGAGPNCENTFTVSFFIPPENEADPPKPTSPDVFLEKWPEMTVYVRQFGGFASDESWLANAKALAESLEGRETFHGDTYFTAGYDSPFKLFNRVNEVWFMKEARPQGKE